QAGLLGRHKGQLHHGARWLVRWRVTMAPDTWRLLLDKPAGGAWNMAVDEVLLDAAAAGTAPPTLRFYAWTPPCLSLGYFQPFDVVDIDGCRALGVEVVRRPTG